MHNQSILGSSFFTSPAFPVFISGEPAAKTDQTWLPKIYTKHS